jgi:hypothetical protein
VGQHETRIDFTVNVNHPGEMRLIEPERIVAAIEEFDLRAQHLGRTLRFLLAAGLDGGERRARLLPGKLALAALAKGQADDFHAVAAFCVKRDGAARAPHEISGMSGNNKTGFHGSWLLFDLRDFASSTSLIAR